MLYVMKRFDRIIAQLETWMLITLTFLITSLLIAQVILRYAFDRPLFWAEEIALQMLVALSFIGVSKMIYSRTLVLIDFIPSLLSKRAAKSLDVLLSLLGLSVLIIFTYLTWQWLSLPESRIEVSPTTGLPRWYFYSVMLLAMVTMCYHQTVSLLFSICDLVTG